MSTAELIRALAVFAEPPSPQALPVAAALGLTLPTPETYTHVLSLQLYPYASVYLGAEGMLGGEARDRIAGFYRAVGATPTTEPDHLTELLAAYADAVDHDTRASGARAAAWRQTRIALLHEHLLSWLPLYLHAVSRLGVEPYASWASLVVDVLRREAEAVGVPEEAAAHLRAAPEPPGPADGLPLFLDGLLAPARAGMIVTPTSLTRAARDLGLGLRVGQRRFVLRAMLDQDASGLLGWLSRHAEESADAMRRAAWAGPSSAAWRARALVTASLLAALSRETSDQPAMSP